MADIGSGGAPRGSEGQDLPNSERDRTELLLAMALPHVMARLQQRHPKAPPGLVESCLDAAVARYSDARVRLYLPIFIERWASEALDVATSGERPV